jgi:hypothetical protein
MKLIGADAKGFLVTSAKQASVLKPWWTPPFLKQRILVTLELEYTAQVSLDEAKRRTLRVLDHAEVAEALEGCRTLGELIEYIAKFMEPFDAIRRKHKW